MKAEPTTARVVIKSKKTSAQVVARAALEMTSCCYVWLDRVDDGVALSLTERAPIGDDLEQRFLAELNRILEHEQLERATNLVRAAIVGRALGPVTPRRRPPAPAPALDPETEAEIEKLLAEIEDDDWLDDASEIAKTWEERFGVDPDPECKEES